jgi:hypothetical protein
MWKPACTSANVRHHGFRHANPEIPADALPLFFLLAAEAGKCLFQFALCQQALNLIQRQCIRSDTEFQFRMVPASARRRPAQPALFLHLTQQVAHIAFAAMHRIGQCR